ncbi:MAG: class I SAM-dependent methyltransferase [Devosia sp.]|nr:class I SAM-dependent methyltransferase [Devosia sp.]
MSDPDPTPIDRPDGRRAFGRDPDNYDEARPAYPGRVFELLRERCGLGQGTRVFEIGPGTGLATRPLLAAGALVTAVEPDPRLAAYLGQHTPIDTLQIVASPFEEANLPRASFDLGCSATAFHWLDQRPALAKVANLLRPGGSWAMWWNVFGDAERDDPFHEATKALLADLPMTPSQPLSWRHPFALDSVARIDDMQSIGAFEDIAFETLNWTLQLDARQVRALYATFSHFSALEPAVRERLLERLYEIAAQDFAGRVERNMCTAIYTARRKSDRARD